MTAMLTMWDVVHVLIDVETRLTPTTMPCEGRVADYSRPCPRTATTFTVGYENDHDYRCARHAQIGCSLMLSPEDAALLKRVRAAIRAVDRAAQGKGGGE